MTGTTDNTNYYKKMGSAYLDYEDKLIEIGETGYQIDLNKLKYVQKTINAYNNDKALTVGEVKFEITNSSIANIDSANYITAKDRHNRSNKTKNTGFN